MKIKYRPEIDGLRAIAVLAVILYHAEFVVANSQVLTGGFLGVDVFFVISGFLITLLLLDELKATGKVSLLRFYERRARRLLPVLLTVMIASLPFAWRVLLPEQIIDYAYSLVATSSFSANIYWHYSLQEYGAESSLLKPFLHTWSLAVEEQYYVIYPLILWLAYKYFKSKIMLITFAGMVLSLLFAEYITTKDSSFSFYMLPSRIWELLAGGILAYYKCFRNKIEASRLVRELLPFIGFALIVGSFTLVSFEEFKHPGVVTITPVVGTIMMIWFSNKDNIIGKCLSSHAFVSVGLISYSLYLWHYPIFAFFRIEGLFDSTYGKITGIVTTFVLSIISFICVEKPLRQAVSRRFFFLLLIALVTTVIATSTYIVQKDGLPSRFAGILALGLEESREYVKDYWGDHSKYTQISDFTHDQTSVEVIGNSWSQDIANALVATGDYQVGFRGMTHAVCKGITLPIVRKDNKNYEKFKQQCAENATRFATNLPNTDLVILADNQTFTSIYDQEMTDAILSNVSTLKEYGYHGPILIITNRPHYKKHIFSIIREHNIAGDGINKYAQKYLVQDIKTLKIMDDRARDFWERHGIHYYSLVDAFCGNDICQVSSNNYPLYHDATHLTQSGASFISDGLSSFIMNEILKP